MQQFYFAGHYVTFDGHHYIARHGSQTLKAPTRRGIEFLIEQVSHIHDALESAEYHAARVVEILTKYIGTNPKSEDENLALINAKKSLAQIIKLQWTKLK